MALRIGLEFYARDAGRAAARGDVVVVIDVLRASSSIIVALARGAKSVLPVKTVEEARKAARLNPEFILAGERRGVPPPGFDYGNSPAAFSRLDLEGKDIVLTTTSGTAAISRVVGARHVLVGAFLNARSVAEAASRLAIDEVRGVTLALAGERGRFSLEDFLGAGSIANYFPRDAVFCDAASAALMAYRGVESSILDAVKRGSHAEHLANIGFGKDVEFCTCLNTCGVVPYLRGGVIVGL